MARLVVALDIGAKYARMAAVSVNGKKVAIERLAEEPVAPEEGPGPAVARLLDGFSTPVDTVVGLFSLQNISLRTLKLPFADRKKIDQVLPFELEGVFPFDVEEAVYNYQLIGKSEGETELLVGAARKELVSSRLQTYRDAAREPRTLLVDAFALESAWRPAGPELGALAETTALLHVGPTESLLLLVREDGYRLARAFRIGYKDLIARAARTAGGEAAQLETALREGTSAVALEQFFAPLVRDVDATLRSSEKTVRIRPAKLFVSGGPSAWPGFADGLGQALRIPATLMEWPEDMRGPTDGHLGDYAPLLGAAVESLRGTGLDMRTGEFTYTRAIQLVKGKLYLTGAFAAVLVLLLVASNVVSYFVKDREADELKAEIEAIFQEAMPNEPIVDPVAQMQAQVRTLRGQAEGSGGQGVVDIFKGMSQAIGGDMTFKINEFHKDASGIRIKAETDSFERLDQIKDSISKIPGLKDIKVSDSKTTPAGGVQFELTLEGAGS